MERRALTELRAGVPLRVSGVTIVPLEERHVVVGCDGHRVFAGADKRPAGILVLDAHGPRAMDATGRPLDLGDASERVVGLREILQLFWDM